MLRTRRIIMSNRYHAVIWIDHRQAEVFHVNEKEQSKLVITSRLSGQRLHHQNRRAGDAHPPVDAEFFGRIASALNHTGGILVTGPGESRFELERYLRRTRPDLADHVELVDMDGHPGEAGLIAMARAHFSVAA
jgi:stalled ribosome rescue protein Dom34